MKIIHVDDTPALLELVKHAVGRQDNNLEILSYESPQNALDALADNPREIGCVLSDYQMPVLNGFEFLAEVRKLRPNIPFVLYTNTPCSELPSEEAGHTPTACVNKGGSKTHYQELEIRLQKLGSVYLENCSSGKVNRWSDTPLTHTVTHLTDD